jgi:hypothetical protein
MRGRLTLTALPLHITCVTVPAVELILLTY